MGEIKREGATPERLCPMRGTNIKSSRPLREQPIARGMEEENEGRSTALWKMTGQRAHIIAADAGLTSALCSRRRLRGIKKERKRIGRGGKRIDGTEARSCLAESRAKRAPCPSSTSPSLFSLSRQHTRARARELSPARPAVLSVSLWRRILHTILNPPSCEMPANVLLVTGRLLRYTLSVKAVK